jgi:hypothetical protein
MLVANLDSGFHSIDGSLNLLALWFIVCCATAEANLNNSDSSSGDVQVLTIGIKLPSGSLRSGIVVSSFAILGMAALLVYCTAADGDKGRV